MIWGKFLGTFLGFVLFGPFGAFLGLIIGHYFDQGLRLHLFPHGFNQPAATVFFNTTFLVMGHLAKADGRVSEKDIAVARTIMQGMRLTDNERQHAIHQFTVGKQSNFDLQAVLKNFVKECGYNSAWTRRFIEIQWQALQGMKPVTTQQWMIFKKICYEVNVNPWVFGIFFQEDSFQQQSHQHHQYQHSRSHSHYAYASGSKVDEAYKILGIQSNASDQEIKRAYRRLMNRYHPDKLTARKASQTEIRNATDQVQKIQAAYELLRERRGIK